MVDYHCSSGFTISGITFITCLSDGIWSAAPTCIAATQIASNNMQVDSSTQKMLTSGRSAVQNGLIAGVVVLAVLAVVGIAVALYLASRRLRWVII